MGARINSVTLVCSALKYKESHNICVSACGVDAKELALINNFSLLFHAGGKYLSIMIVYYAPVYMEHLVHFIHLRGQKGGEHRQETIINFHTDVNSAQTAI